MSHWENGHLSSKKINVSHIVNILSPCLKQDQFLPILGLGPCGLGGGILCFSAAGEIFLAQVVLETDGD